MVIKPALDFNHSHFIWELSEIDIPDNLISLIDNGNFERLNDSLDKDFNKNSPARYKFESMPSPEEHNAYVRKIFNRIIPSTILTEDYDMSRVWPFHFRKKVAEANPPMGGDIIKDKPGFSMSVHLDNNVVLGTALLNLKDNPNSYTEYYSDFSGENCIYRGPSKKGTGTFHYNSPYLFHNGFNKGTEDRLIAYSSLPNIGF